MNDLSGLCFVTGGSRTEMICASPTAAKELHTALPLPNAESAGAFALHLDQNRTNLVVVGGDYHLPEQASRTSAWSSAAAAEWSPSSSYPHGYRSSVAFDTVRKTWITVGPNGTDVSRDNGKNWTPLRPGKSDQPDADRNWNALSLPFVVGPHGRIGRLREDALVQAK